jgi:hypothetical protein
MALYVALLPAAREQNKEITGAVCGHALSWLPFSQRRVRVSAVQSILKMV